MTDGHARPCDDDPGTTGFTLVEMLVSLSILAIMAVLLAGGVHLGLRAWESGQKRLETADRLERSDAFLRQLLSQTVLIVGPGTTSNDPNLGFAGTATGISFIAPLPYQFGGGPRYAFELSIAAQESGDELDLAWRPFNRTPSDASLAAGQAALLDRLQSATLSYYGNVPGTLADRWYPSWDGRAGLPKLIRLDLDGLPPPDPPHVSLYLAPMMFQSGA